MKSVWEEKAANELRTLLRAAGMSYAELAAALALDGVNAASLTKRLYRGAFTHAFFLECKEAARQHRAQASESADAP
jgi:hypothetical protein